MRINTNVSSLVAQEANKQTNVTLANSLEKLSTGFKINKASDDASGLSIADKLRTQANGLNQAVANGNSAVTLTQIADKAMAEQSNILDVVKQKLIQASTATTSAEGIEAIGKDISKLLEQLNNIAAQTTYNGTNLLQGTASAGSVTSGIAMTFQMGTTASDVIKTASGTLANTAGLNGMSALKTGVEAWSAGLDATVMQASARGQLVEIDSALTQLNSWRADFGSTQNQLESSIRNLMTQVTNTKAAESVIRDVDYAQESANFNKQNIISQAGTYAISQANNVSQNIMRLLQ
ncbi:flagellin [Arcobacter sp. 15-2]|uniref:flagellin N-terminal helical domain-containing protein n=1 Tax=Arcobacter sp. 15-2 TaxID=3374109 RepID=UPI00399C6341